mgnify:CR=1 FL=1
MMAKNLTPIGDRVVVKPEPEEVKTRSGIVLPDSAKEKPQDGTVIAVGAGRVLDNGQKVAPEVKVGDKLSTASTVGPKSKSKMKSILSCPKEIFSQLKNSL